MESISSDKREVLLDTLLQVKEAIENLLTWNKGIADMNQLLLSPSGTQALAGNCMTIMAVAEDNDLQPLLDATSFFIAYLKTSAE